GQSAIRVPGGTTFRDVAHHGTPQKAYLSHPALTCWATALSSLTGLLKQLLELSIVTTRSARATQHLTGGTSDFASIVDALIARRAHNARARATRRVHLAVVHRDALDLE